MYWGWWLVIVVLSVGWRRDTHGTPLGRTLPQESRLQYARTIASSVLSRAPPGAQLIGARGEVQPLVNRLIQNASSIRQNIVDTFSCVDRVYGYYADQANECQIFHICVPMQQLFPDLYDTNDIFHFSFICPGYTIFTQDAMVCAWQDYAFPCSEAHHLYHRNNHFFVVPAEDVPKDSAVSLHFFLFNSKALHFFLFNSQSLYFFHFNSKALHFFHFNSKAFHFFHFNPKTFYLSHFNPQSLHFNPQSFYLFHFNSKTFYLFHFNPQALHFILFNPQSFYSLHFNSKAFHFIHFNSKTFYLSHFNPQSFHLLHFNLQSLHLLHFNLQLLYSFHFNPQSLHLPYFNPQSLHLPLFNPQCPSNPRSQYYKQ
ncbi:hypothetical protein Pmani_024470 [Petrolisthes manimaculis]|uniref:Chitin-binding type-2 domain-containing protein n=1 Tax=Petrolisthes manimaculis TaxID=1843537 RepID=A0AAE1TYN0_9EUCA|nr:hypothetical protein Pmani_024470 [Petrolisthes manimaculis]